jgi:hypothetical protein
VANDGNLDILELAPFWTGNPLGESIQDLWVNATTVEHDGTPDDVLQTYMNLPIFSRRLREHLGHAGILGIEYLPLKVYASTGFELDGFAIANILNRLPALDLDQSRYSVFGPEFGEKAGKLRGLIRPVLRARSLSGLDILRAEEYEQRIFVSEHFKKTFETGHFTGYSFRQVRVTGMSE